MLSAPAAGGKTSCSAQRAPPMLSSHTREDKGKQAYSLKCQTIPLMNANDFYVCLYIIRYSELPNEVRDNKNSSTVCQGITSPKYFKNRTTDERSLLTSSTDKIENPDHIFGNAQFKHCFLCPLLLGISLKIC